MPRRPSGRARLRALATSAEHTTLFFTDHLGRRCAPGGPAASRSPLIALRRTRPGVAPCAVTLDGHDCTVLAQRSASGRVAFAAYPTEQESAGAWWTESGSPTPAARPAGPDGAREGRVVAATVSRSTPAGLRLARRKDEPGLALTAWREV